MKRVYTMVFFIVLFGTALNAQLVLSENFSDGIPTDWTIVTNATDDGWNALDASDASSSFLVIPDNGGGNVAITNDDACDCNKLNDWLITPELDLSGLTAPQLYFDRAFGGFIAGGNTETATIEVSVDGGTTWEVISTLEGQGTLSGQGVGTLTWVSLETIDLTAYAGMSGVQIAFHYSDASGWLYGFAVDNVLVYEPVDWEIELSGLDIDPIQLGGTEVSIDGQVRNLGSNAVTSFDLEWTDGTNNYSETVSGVNIAQFGTYDFSANDALSVVAASSTDITVTISNPNGNMDSNASNNSAMTSINGVAFVPDKAVVVEESTGTWCGWCPNGTVALEYMAENYPSTFIGIAVHNGDPMTIAEYDSNNGLTSAPASNVDRVLLDVYPNSSNLELVHNQRMMEIAPASITQELIYDQATREITINLSSEFVAPVSDDLRFNAVIVEDGVTGTSSGYNQENYFSSQSQNISLVSLDGTNWRDLPATIPASQMVYDHVARAILGGYFGQTGSLPANVAAGETHTYTFTYTLPADFDENEIHVVGMLLDGVNDDILNAISTKLDVPVATKDLNYNENLAKVFPNPMSDQATIQLNLEESEEVTVQVFNSIGQKMEEQFFGRLLGEQNLSFNASKLANGLYQLHIIVGEQVVTKKVTIAR